MLNYYYKPKSILSFDREISIRYKQRSGLESNYNINSLIINPYTHKPLPIPYIPTIFVNPTKILFHILATTTGLTILELSTYTLNILIVARAKKHGLDIFEDRIYKY